MHASLTPDEVRQVVIRVFGQHAEVTSVDERLRVENGRLVARCYRANGLFAMWLVPVGVLQFYNVDGSLLQTINLRAMVASDRLAA